MSAPDDRSLSDRMDAAADDARARGPVGRFLHRVNALLGPIGKILSWLGRWLRRWLRWVFFEKDLESGERRLAWRQVPAHLGLSITAVFLLHVGLSALYFYSTYFDETVYVTGKQEIVTGELYQFGGCTSLPCSTDTDNGKFYLVESSLYFPTLLYPEEDVFANIPQQNGACSIEGYGIYFRTLRWLYKSAQLYQHVVDVSCRPYTEEEIRRSVEGGQIVNEATIEPTAEPIAPVETTPPEDNDTQ